VQALKSIPIKVKKEETGIVVKFQELVVVEVTVEEAGYKISHVTPEWAATTSYFCEDAEDATSFFYYIDGIDECINEVKQLVLFEEKRKPNQNYVRYNPSIDWDVDKENLLKQWEMILKNILDGSVYYVERNSTSGEKNVDIFRSDDKENRICHVWPKKDKKNVTYVLTGMSLIGLKQSWHCRKIKI
jgi:hypothetical protein